MKSIPVATDRLSALVVSVAAATDNDHKPRANAAGELLYRVQVLVMVDGAERGELCDVTVPGKPEVHPMSAVEFENLRARAWSMVTGRA